MHPSRPGALEKIGLLAESSWEVCNKIGGIYTVLSTKAKVLQEVFGDSLVFIGPDVWTEENPSPNFKEDKNLLKGFSKTEIGEFDIKVRTGRWKIPGSPQVILVEFSGVYPHLNDIFGKMWEKFEVDSMHEYGDYREGCAFSIASAIVISRLSAHLGIKSEAVTAHFNEWTTGMGLLYFEMIQPESATLFTTHATSIGRSICGNGKPLYDYFDGYNGDQMAAELNMVAKHSLEKQVARHADCFTAVSELTAKEAEKLLEVRPQVVTPNGFEPGFVPGDRKYASMRKNGRKKIFSIASVLKGREFDPETLIVATSGRNEYRNKGLDIYLDALSLLSKETDGKKVLGLILVPAWVSHPAPYLLSKSEGTPINDYITHILHNMDSDNIALKIRNLESEGDIKENVEVVYIPCYLDGNDGIVNISYYDLLPAIDMTVFASYYEPWGYTPLESVAFGLPTVTTDKSGFGQWIVTNKSNGLLSSGVRVVSRTDSNYHETVEEIAGVIEDYSNYCQDKKDLAREAAVKTASEADWKYFIEFYFEAFKIASERREERNKKRKIK